MPLMTWQLWLAKDLVQQHHLPWQSSQKNLTPGKSPGWKTGQKRRDPIAKKELFST
jgi:hypothetical protein